MAPIAPKTATDVDPSGKNIYITTQQTIFKINGTFLCTHAYLKSIVHSHVHMGKKRTKKYRIEQTVKTYAR